MRRDGCALVLEGDVGGADPPPHPKALTATITIARAHKIFGIAPSLWRR
jgi:hypothetical protein